MKVSIILPTYRPGEYLFELLSKLNTQEFDKDLFEILIVLNGDYSYYDRIQNFLETSMSRNIRLLYSPLKGVSNARNVGIDSALGEYILFIDDDDLVSDNYIKELYENRLQNGITVCNCLDFSTSIDDARDSFISKAYYRLSNISDVKYYTRSFFSSCWGKLIPRNIIGNKRFNGKVALGEDCCFMLSILPDIKEIKKAPEDCKYFIRNREGSATRKSYTFKYLCTNKLNQLYDYITNCTHAAKENFPIYINRIIALFLKW